MLPFFSSFLSQGEKICQALEIISNIGLQHPPCTSNYQAEILSELKSNSVSLLSPLLLTFRFFPTFSLYNVCYPLLPPLLCSSSPTLPSSIYHLTLLKPTSAVHSHKRSDTAEPGLKQQQSLHDLSIHSLLLHLRSSAIALLI